MHETLLVDVVQGLQSLTDHIFDFWLAKVAIRSLSTHHLLEEILVTKFEDDIKFVSQHDLLYFDQIGMFGESLQCFDLCEFGSLVPRQLLLHLLDGDQLASFLIHGFANDAVGPLPQLLD